MSPDNLATMLEYIGENLTMDDSCRVIFKSDSTFVNTWSDRDKDTGAITRMCQVQDHRLPEIQVQETICLFERDN
jgi:hypothetical protein